VDYTGMWAANKLFIILPVMCGVSV